MNIATVEPWVEAPLRRYVDDARARLALLLHPSGQVVAQAGFTRAIDVMTACALAAAVHATSGELGRQLDGRPFRGLHHAGPEKQMYLAPVETARGCVHLPHGVRRRELARTGADVLRRTVPGARGRGAAAGARFGRRRSPWISSAI